MVYVIIIVSLIGLTLLLGIANIILTRVKKKKEKVSHSEKGE